MLSLSIVSHGQSVLIRHLLDDLARLQWPDIEVIITVNIPEDESTYENRPYPVKIIRNVTPKGFGANHNSAFEVAKGSYFIVVNPDIRLQSLNMHTLLVVLDHPKVGVVVPSVYNSAGNIEDSARHFPTIGRLVQRIIFRRRTLDYHGCKLPVDIDWGAGMFMVFRPDAFALVNGFDHNRFFMYLEDVDICKRLNDRGWRVVLQPAARVVHDAQRGSHKSLQHLRWHLTSTFRYLTGL